LGTYGAKHSPVGDHRVEQAAQPGHSASLNTEQATHATSATGAALPRDRGERPADLLSGPVPDKEAFVVLPRNQAQVVHGVLASLATHDGVPLPHDDGQQPKRRPQTPQGLIGELQSQ
jgi:hypothetical protein